MRWFQCFLPSNLQLSAAVQMSTDVQMTTALYLKLVLTNLSESTKFNISTLGMPFLQDRRKMFFHGKKRTGKHSFFINIKLCYSTIFQISVFSYLP